MKIKYFNIKAKTLDELVCSRVLFGVETICAEDDYGNELAIINIDHLYSIEQ